jgi:hypothetical protein
MRASPTGAARRGSGRCTSPTQCEPNVVVFVMLASAMKLLEMPTLQLGVLLVGLVLIGLPVWERSTRRRTPESTWQRVGLRRGRSRA